MPTSPSKDIRPSPNQRFLEKISGGPSGDEKPGQNEAPYTDATNMDREGLGGTLGWDGSTSTWDSPDRRENPKNMELNRDGLESESDMSDLSLGSLGYQSVNGK